MFKLGKRQTLTLIKKTDFGAYLADTLDPDRKDGEEVLLPKKEVTPDMEIMDPIDVFLYKDSKDRLIATTREGMPEVGEIAKLKVREVNNIGAFLDWGLEKDLLLPYKQQKGTVAKGDEVTVSIYIDKSKRLCATMWISDEEKKSKTYEQNAEKLLKLLKKNNRFLPVCDKSSPEAIKEVTGMSKNEFKKAVGNLYKQRKINLEEEGIRLI